MKTLVFEGYSDDTFGEYGVTNDDHDNCANGDPIVFAVHTGANPTVGEGMFVWGLYSPDGAPQATGGTWVIGIQQLNEDQPLPDWPMRWKTAESRYSPRLEIDVPDHITVAYVGEK